jgi:glycosyltransferase involved in cell wall biosynthesis
MNAMDVLVLPSRTTARWKEQFGRVIIEAHCCATPVIGSSSGAIPDVVGEGGRVFPECDAPALAAALCTMAENLSGARAMGEKGRQHALANSTWESVAGRMANIYRRLQEAPPTAAVGAPPAMAR